MEPSLKIRNLLKCLGITQAELAARIGVHPSTIGLYLYGKRCPDALTCLLFAGLTENIEERRSWLADSGLNDTKIELISRALGVSRPASFPAPPPSDPAMAHPEQLPEPRYEVKRIIEPGETLISAARKRLPRIFPAPEGPNEAALPAAIRNALATLDPGLMEALGRMLIEIAKQGKSGSSKRA